MKKGTVWPAVAGALMTFAVGAWAAGEAQSQDAGSSAIREIPKGYRDWTMISIASVGGNFKDLRVKLGNDAAIKAYRDGSPAFPDGAIIARLAYKQATSDENNAAFAAAAKGRLSPEDTTKLLAESFVAGAPTNVQFMVKDSTKYAATGGWGFAQFTDGKPDDGPALKTCFGCHAPAKGHDFVFTRYSP